MHVLMRTAGMAVLPGNLSLSIGAASLPLHFVTSASWR